jgi:hypothetical protein
LVHALPDAAFLRHFYTNGRKNSVSGLREKVFLHLLSQN